MVDYYKLPTPRKLPKPEPEDQPESLEPTIDVVWNVVQEKGDAKSFALKVSIRLPLKS